MSNFDENIASNMEETGVPDESEGISAARKPAPMALASSGAVKKSRPFSSSQDTQASAPTCVPPTEETLANMCQDLKIMSESANDVSKNYKKKGDNGRNNQQLKNLAIQILQPQAGPMSAPAQINHYQFGLQNAPHMFNFSHTENPQQMNNRLNNRTQMCGSVGTNYAQNMAHHPQYQYSISLQNPVLPNMMQMQQQQMLNNLHKLQTPRYLQNAFNHPLLSQSIPVYNPRRQRVVNNITNNKQKPESPKHNTKNGKNTNKTQSQDNFQYESYLSIEEVEEGLKSNQLIEGVIRINPKQFQYAYVTGFDRSEQDIHIDGMRNRNRALEGDVVIVQIIAKENKKSTEESKADSTEESNSESTEESKEGSQVEGNAECKGKSKPESKILKVKAGKQKTSKGPSKKESKSESKEEGNAECKEENEAECKGDSKPESKILKIKAGKRKSRKRLRKKESKAESKEEGKAECKEEDKAECKEEDKAECKKEDNAECKEEDKAECKRESKPESKKLKIKAEKQSSSQSASKKESKAESTKQCKEEGKGESKPENKELKIKAEKQKSSHAESKKDSEAESTKQCTEEGKEESKPEKQKSSQAASIKDSKAESKEYNKADIEEEINEKSAADIKEESIVESKEEIDKESKEESKPKKGKVVYIKEKVHTRTCIGTLKLMPDKNKQKAIFVPRDYRVPRLNVLSTSWPDNFYHDSKRYENTLFLAKIQHWFDTRFAVGYIKSMIGQAGDMVTETKAILAQNDLDITPYGPETRIFYPSMDYKIPEDEISLREDCRKLCLFSIDPFNCRDIDDAVSCRVLENGNYEIGVHISDVAHFLAEGTILDDKVANKATTIYLVEKAYHMLPDELCILCSLFPGMDKLAFSVFWEITKDAKVLSHRFAKTVIQSCSQLAYEHAQAIIDDKPRDDEFPEIFNGFKYEDIRETIKILNSIAVKFRNDRFEGGALRIDQPKMSFKLSPTTGLPESFTIYDSKQSHQLIEEFMLLANMTVAKRIYEDHPKLAFLRCHPPPSSYMLNQLQRALKPMGIDLDISSAGNLHRSLLPYMSDEYSNRGRAMVLNMLCAKPMTRAKYFCASCVDDDEFRHYALNVPLYTHFTSPIRRYADIMVHRLLAASLKYRKNPTWDVDKVKYIAAQCNKQKYNAKKAGEMSTELYALKYVEMNSPVVTEAVVVEIREKYIDVIVVAMGLNRRIFFNSDFPGTYTRIKSEESIKMAKMELKWNATDKLPETSQTIEVFSVIEIEMYKGDDMIRVETKIVRPNNVKQ